jgi:hypothetical protein
MEKCLLLLRWNHLCTRSFLASKFVIPRGLFIVI